MRTCYRTGLAVLIQQSGGGNGGSGIMLNKLIIYK